MLAAIGYLAGLPCFYFGFISQDKTVYLTMLTLGAFFIFMCMPAVNTQIANSVNPKQRATAWALAVFILHLLGDTVAPVAFGAVSQNLSASLGSEGLGRQQAFLYFAFALVPASLCCFVAAGTAKKDIAKVQAEIEAE